MSRSMILLIVSAVIAAMVIISVRNRLSAPPAESPVAAEPTSSRILYARRDITPGNFVQGVQDLEWKEAPKDTPTGGLLFEGTVRPEDFNGAVVRRMLRAGEPVVASALTKAGDGGFMSAVLEPGMRAVSVAVTPTSGNAGFLTPGDRVDLIVTHRVRTQIGKDQSNTEETVVSETFVRDVRVVAIDQMLDNPENKAVLAKTVTVEVSPRQAEQVAVASEMGKISFSLRSLAANQVKKLPDISPDKKPGDANLEKRRKALEELYGDGTRDSDVSQLLERSGSIVSKVHVFRGDQSENIQFNRGAQ